MTREERDYIQQMVNNVTVEIRDPLNLEEMKAFIKGYELAQMNMLDAVDQAYRDFNTD